MSGKITAEVGRETIDICMKALGELPLKVTYMAFSELGQILVAASAPLKPEEKSGAAEE
jgi:hypothetical protein